jgi:hypothetical protein
MTRFLIHYFINPSVVIYEIEVIDSPSISRSTSDSFREQGVCPTDLRLDTSTNGLKHVYTSPQEIYGILTF